MAKVIIYDAEGMEHSREAVDARECVASGSYTLEPPTAETGGGESGESGEVGKKAKKTGKAGE